jgi:hypothetical protein
MEEDPKPPIEDMQNSLAFASHSRQPVFTDREMWVAIRGYILGLVKAIDLYANGGPLVMATRAALLGISKAIELRWNLKKSN